MVDEQIAQSVKALGLQEKYWLPDAGLVDRGKHPSPLTTCPIRALSPREQERQNQLTRSLPESIAYGLWGRLPEDVRESLKPRLRKLLK